ncbi:melanophilin-like isoform 2-T2 [Aulostomus maculatus]
MPGAAAGKKLDLSQLTDEEAQHVWEVVRRDFDLRKKEEDRLGELKTKLEKEDSKRELLGNQTSLTESHCIRCLEPFKFLVNSKRQCLDCQLYTCKSCSRFNKKEHGWVCDSCHMARVLKIGTLEWYHENVRARFKRFGSAKVMRSLFNRLSGEHSSSTDDLRDKHESDAQSMPEDHGAHVPLPGVSGDGRCSTGQGFFSGESKDRGSDAGFSQASFVLPEKNEDNLTMVAAREEFSFPVANAVEYEEHHTSATDSQQYKGMKKTKRRLTVDPVDFDLDPDYTIQSRGHSAQEQPKELDFDTDVGLELGLTPQQDDLVYSDYRSLPSRSISQLSYSSCGSGSAGGHRGGYLPGPEDSEEEEDLGHHYPVYHANQGPCNHASQERRNSPNPPPQISDLDRRMSAIESLLNRLEQKVTPTYDQTDALQIPDRSSPLPLWEEADLEEQQLRRKLHELTGNISDHSLTSDEDESNRSMSFQEIPAARSQEDVRLTRIPSRPTSRTGIVVSRLDEKQPQQTDSHKTSHSAESLEKKWLPLEEGSKASFKGSTALLVELEDKVAQAAASLHSAQSEVSFIENRIAALNAAGMPVDRRRKSAIPIQARRLSQNFPTNQVDRFVRNSQYRGSLTQRNPGAKPKTRATCAKPVMTPSS